MCNPAPCLELAITVIIQGARIDSKAKLDLCYKSSVTMHSLGLCCEGPRK